MTISKLDWSYADEVKKDRQSKEKRGEDDAGSDLAGAVTGAWTSTHTLARVDPVRHGEGGGGL